MSSSLNQKLLERYTLESCITGGILFHLFQKVADGKRNNIRTALYHDGTFHSGSIIGVHARKPGTIKSINMPVGINT